MTISELPLLSCQPPRQVLLFPLTSRIGKIRHTARLLMNKQDEDADLYWKQVAASNRRHLSRVGMSESEIDSELRSFFDAVRCEMVRLACHNKGSGDAA